MPRMFPDSNSIGKSARIIANQTDLDRLARDLRAVEQLAVDTEADSMYHYAEQLCLIQLSSAAGDVLVDPLAGLDLQALAPVFADPTRRKILHACDNDLRILQRDANLRLRGLFDTRVAARLLGEPDAGTSLAALCQKFLGVKLDKGQQHADWSRRPLHPKMIAYAAADTCHLAALTAVLAQRLDALDRRSWALQEFDHLEQITWQPKRPDPEPFRRIKGAEKLPPRDLAVLREVYAFRDALGRQKDVPVANVLLPAALLWVSAEKPRTLDALAPLPGRSRLLDERALRGLLEAIARGVACPDADLPERQRPTPHPRPDPRIQARLARARERRDAVAAKLGIAGPLLASNTALEAALKALDEGADVSSLPGLRRWQADLLREALRPARR